MADPRIKFDLFSTYIATIKNSVGTKMFRNIYVIENKRRRDVAKNGRVSCAAFVSSVLVISDNLIKSSHTTVKGLLEDMRESGWHKIDKPKKGAVLVWTPLKQMEDLSKDIISFPWENEDRWHPGFYVGKNTAISNNSDSGTPTKHPWTYRKVDSIWWNDRLNN
ncbi:MAG: hypothetical protein A3F94_02660 [Candidatus Spechtbacteria bacterium RIFCSPLOWO2_12_FULL_38_22]|uniref:Uncharacterized protein n=1 Tax=Candidatus Spechtbacteria bacterium RIFCSPLOWO2_12_FULL_38_22 TaxID=1802165 RepID=A0A1G2HI80_9BACT|nr:MAG: hypothetical protein A2728_00270 [Candidatus Spechtbacteria bacterium RIFCSPHIGHO2_01_FULL_38_11]OGZ59424.1 MAG: hypothetical protein A3A00_01815 [Candidatus Spechtbacteria bacterium RIFCSPLOWO2_01_FULL_38_20]OGZ60094.1 MAG: hypothetical protein A3E58_02005 [Candidatus Spechtbacteria bacterium RIFCSPHIGHO2_12_FULL_38_30]OGZ62206.1 MAG: hypothetical protein A3F94_02660 [Candidatus Spechtbacteria bacterium RIFCSPLOWO2_12_FULL_38_22]